MAATEGDIERKGLPVRRGTAWINEVNRVRRWTGD